MCVEKSVQGRGSPQRAEWTGDDFFHLRETETEMECRALAVRKRQRSSRGREEGEADLMSSLPDECLLQVFACLPRPRDRCACAAVCMRWLMLQSHMRWSEFKKSSEGEEVSPGFGGKELEEWESPDLYGAGEGGEGGRVERQPMWAVGDLSRKLEGRKATDVRLAAIAVGTLARGGLGKLSIREGGCGDKLVRGVSDFGVSAVGFCCAALRSLSLWYCSGVGDEGLVAIAKGCCLLDKLDILKCPGIGDVGMRAVAYGCSLLTELSVDSCDNVSDQGLRAFGHKRSLLTSVAVLSCPLVGDDGVQAIVKGTNKLCKLRLHRLGVTDAGLRSVADYGGAVTKLILSELEYVTQKGFASLGLSAKLLKLKTLLVCSCKGLTDVSLAAIGKGCPDLRLLALFDCVGLGDEGLECFAQLCSSLASLHLVRCHAISLAGLKSVLSVRGQTLRILHLSRCSGISDSGFSSLPFTGPCASLKSLSLIDCKGIGDRCLELVARSCPSLEQLDLSGLSAVSDSGVVAAVTGCGKSLVSLNLSGCFEVSNRAVCSIARLCGGLLQSLMLNGCWKVTDESLKVIAEECTQLKDLDVSRCSITDAGVYAVVAARGQGLQSLSLESCMDITDDCLPVIEKDCEYLWGLNLKHCERLSRGALDSFESRLFRCDLICS